MSWTFSLERYSLGVKVKKDRRTHRILVRAFQQLHADRSPASWCPHQRLCLRYRRDTERSCSRPTPAAPVGQRKWHYVRHRRFQRKKIILMQECTTVFTFWICPANSLVGAKISAWVSRTYSQNGIKKFMWWRNHYLK